MKENKEMKRKARVRNWISKMAVASLAMMTMLYANGFVVYAASGNYGKNAAMWFLDQVFWIVVCAAVVIAAVFFLKKNTTGGIVTLIAGAVILVFIKNPTMLSSIGENIMNKVLQ